MKLKCTFTILLISLLFCSCKSSHSSKKNSSLDGEWIGLGYQFDTDSEWDMKLKCKFKNNEYTIEYPSLSCGGNWNLISCNEQSYEFREVIVKGKSICTNAGKMVLQLQENGEIEFKYFWPDDETLSAVGRLSKKK